MNKIIGLWFVLCFALPFQLLAADAPEPKSEIIYRANLGRADDVRILLDKGISVEQADNNGVPILALAAARQDDEGLNVVKLLVDKGANINATDSKGQTALFYAARHDNKQIVQYLLDKGVNYYLPDKNGYIARTVAYDAGHQEIVKLMDDFVKKQTADVNAQYEETNKIIMERYKALEKPAEQQPVIAPPVAADKQPDVQPLVSQEVPATPAEPTEKEKAEKEAKDKQHIMEMKKTAADLSFHYCAYQYWYYCRSSKQSTELSDDELNMSIDSHTDAINDLSEKIAKDYKEYVGDPKFLTNVGDSAKNRIFNELNAMTSKAERHEKGVGRMDDMQTRCGDIAREWDIAAPPVSMPKAKGGSVGGAGGLGPIPQNQKTKTPAITAVPAAGN